jgi:hypothetical protein
MGPEDSSTKRSRREEDALEPMYDFMEELLSMHNGKPQTVRDARKDREQQGDAEEIEPRGSWSERDRAIGEIYGKGFLIEMIRILEPVVTDGRNSSAGGEERRSRALDRMRRYKSEVEERKRRLAIQERVRDCYEEIEWRVRRAEEDQKAIKQRQEEVNECRQKLDQIQANETEEGKEDGAEKAERLAGEVLGLRERVATDERSMEVIQGQLTDEGLCYSFEGRANLDMQWARTQENVKLARDLTTSFRFCHRQGHFLYHSRALSELTRYTLPRSHAPFWRACQPVVKVAEDQPRVMFKGLRRAGKPPNQLGASICPRPLIFEQADRRTGRDSRHMPQDH